MAQSALHDRARLALDESRARMVRQSPEPLGAFFIGSAPVGRLGTEVRNSLCTDRFADLVRWTPIGLMLKAENTVEDRSAKLTEMLRRLGEDNLAKPLLGEEIDVVYHGELLSRVDRSAVRLLGFPTLVVRLLVKRADGRWLMQKRSAAKRVGPGLIDNFAAGMVTADETADTALLRETHEETGIALDASALTERRDLFFKSLRPVREGYLVEENAVYEVSLPEGISPRPLDGEVDSFIDLSTEELLQLIEEEKVMPEAAHLILLEMATRA